MYFHHQLIANCLECRKYYILQKNKRNVLWIFGPTWVLFVSAVFYYKYRNMWSLVVSKFVMFFKLSLLALKEFGIDKMYAKQNKTDLPLKTGRIAIVTGGSRGIGASVVKMLLQCDMEVIIACRTPTAGDKLIYQIRKSGIIGGTAKVYRLDNASLESVKEFVEQIKKDYSKIHILVNNAGIMFGLYSETKEGFEQQWGVNYLSHFLLTILLLPLLKKGGHPEENSRIINVTSCAHLYGEIEFDNINNRDQFNTYAKYCQSKLAQVISTKTLQNIFNEKKLNIQIYSVHPGIVGTDLFDYSYVKFLKVITPYLLKTPDQGAIPIVYTATNKCMEKRGGAYINNCTEFPAHPCATNKLIQERLLILSLKQVQINNYMKYF